MQFREILTMALASVGANKLRSALTMLGITIGVFSVISVMTAIGAMQASIESGLTLFGSNIFQFAKYPVSVNAGGKGSQKYENRRDINYREAQRYAELMEGNAQEICLKVFDGGKQAVYNGVKTTPSLTIVGTNKSFLTANAYTLAYGRNLNEEDVGLSRRVLVIGRDIEKRLFPHESPIGRVIKLNGSHFHNCRRDGRKRDSVWPKPGRYRGAPHHSVFRRFRLRQSDDQHRDPILLPNGL